MLETIYNTESIESSAYMLTAYETGGLIDVKQYAIDEIVTPYLDGLDDSDLIGAYNEFADEIGYEPYYNNDDELFCDMDPMEAVRCTYYGNYNFMDEYAKFNGYGNIDTYRAYQVRENIMNEDEFLSWVYDNYYYDDEEEKRESAALELVRKGY